MVSAQAMLNEVGLLEPLLTYSEYEFDQIRKEFLLRVWFHLFFVLGYEAC